MRLSIFGYFLEINLYKQDKYIQRVIATVNELVADKQTCFSDISLKIERIKAIRLPYVTKMFPKNKIDLNESGIASLLFAKNFVEEHWR